MKDSNEITENFDNCFVCGDYLLPVIQPQEMICAFCGKPKPAKCTCKDNHFVCDDCLKLDLKVLIKKICLKTRETDPIALAKLIMELPTVKMHGPEHHFITPAVLLTTVSNLTGNRQNLAEQLKQAELLANKLAPTCTWHIGTCGAATGAAIFLLLWKGLNPEEESSWDEANIIVANSLKRIAQLGTPRCCKRDTYVAIEETVDFLRENYNLDLPISEAKCNFSLRNQTCKREDCIYFNLKFALV